MPAARVSLSARRGTDPPSNPRQPKGGIPRLQRQSPSPACAEADKMFEPANELILGAVLKAANHGGAKARSEMGILAEALRDTSPARVATDIEHGGEGPIDSLLGCFIGRRASATFHKVVIPGCRESERYWENSIEAVDDVASDQQRNAVRALFSGDALQFLNRTWVDFVDDRPGATFGDAAMERLRNFALGAFEEHQLSDLFA